MAAAAAAAAAAVAWVLARSRSFASRFLACASRSFRSTTAAARCLPSFASERWFARLRAVAAAAASTAAYASYRAADARCARAAVCPARSRALARSPRVAERLQIAVVGVCWMIFLERFFFSAFARAPISQALRKSDFLAAIQLATVQISCAEHLAEIVYGRASSFLFPQRQATTCAHARNLHLCAAGGISLRARFLLLPPPPPLPPLRNRRHHTAAVVDSTRLHSRSQPLRCDR